MLQERVVRFLHRLECFVRLAGGQRMWHDLIVGGFQGGGGGLTVNADDLVVADQCAALMRGHRAGVLAQSIQRARLDVDRVTLMRQDDVNGGHGSSQRIGNT